MEGLTLRSHGRLRRIAWRHFHQWRRLNSSHASLAAAYDPEEVERGRYEWWEEKGCFSRRTPAQRQPTGQAARPVFSMLLPPPNVTGSLHVGHALTVALQDCLARWRRMHGDDVSWIPGLDHAGIATQSVVERRLLADQGWVGPRDGLA